MKNISLLVAFALVLMVKNDFTLIKNSKAEKVLVLSIDYLAENFYLKRINYFLELEIEYYSREDNSFIYNLHKRFCTNQIDSCCTMFYRSHGIPILINFQDTSVINRKLYLVKDSMSVLVDKLQCSNVDEIDVLVSSIRRVTYKNDTLIGESNFDYHIQFTPGNFY